ncbi:S8 family serine peptidase [Candidatus Woesearchaeota archaeon]|nr:S8 family serine peptidase [Candidatus Woesearchaeota archaeon]
MRKKYCCKKHPIRSYFHRNEYSFILFTVAVFFILIVFGLGYEGYNLITGHSIDLAGVRIDPYLYELFEKNEVVGVVVIGNIDEELDGVVIKTNFAGGFSADITEDGLKNLLKNNIKEVYYDYPINLLLTESRGIVKADITNSITKNNALMDGRGFTACVIDTGVNNHPYLNGRIIKEACFCTEPEGINSGCCANGLNEQYSGVIGDLHGHGTHVAGIIAANGSVIGMAPGANIVAIRILNSTGAGVSSDLVKAIQFCVSNSSLYNISVVSMSLGCGMYTGYCDGLISCDISLIENEIENGVNKGIIFVASTGNSGSKTSIASPACLNDVIAVSSTNKDDTISSFSNRNNIVSILAPGGSITSLSNTGGTTVFSGTSQAAPHVSGGILILKQYNSSLDKTTIKQILFDNGVQIQDLASGLTFARLNIYASLLNITENTTEENNTIDTTTPLLIVYKPLNNEYVNKTFELEYYATDNNLTEVYYLLNGNKTILNGNATITLQDYGVYILDVYANDTSGNYAFVNRTIHYLNGSIYVNLNEPTNGYIFSVSNLTLKCNAVGYNLSNLSLYYGIINQTMNYYSTTTNTNAVFTLNLSDNFYYWNCLASNFDNTKNFSSLNLTFTIDTTKPILELKDIGANNTILDSNFNLGYKVSDANVIAKCMLMCAEVEIMRQNLVTKDTWNYFNVTNAGTYECYIKCEDVVGNFGNSLKWNFLIESENSDGGSGGEAISNNQGQTDDGEFDLLDEDKQENVEESVQEGVPDKEIKKLVENVIIDGKDISDIIIKELTQNIYGVVLPTDLVYKYFDLEGTTINGDLRFTFNVERVWLDGNNLQIDDISLWAYDNEEWVPVDTKYLGEDGNYLQFESSFNKFTTFAISTKENKLNNELNLHNSELSQKWKVFLWSFGIILTIGTVALVIFRHKINIRFFKKPNFIEKKGLEVKKGGIKGDSSETIFDD